MIFRNIQKTILRSDRIFLLFMIDFKQKLQEAEKLERKNQTGLSEEDLLIDGRRRKKITIYVVTI